MGPDLDSLLTTAVRAAAEASPQILSVYRGSFTVDRKADRSPITEADRRSNRIIVERLSRETSFPILSEEGEAIPYRERKSWRRFWCVDPLDGTKEFVKRNGEFTINIAFIENAAPVLGLVYAPVLGLLYCAHQDIGSYKLAGFSDFFAALPDPEDDRLLAKLLGHAEKLSRKSPLVLDRRKKRPAITVIGSRSHRGPDFEEYLGEIERLYAERVEVITVGSALKPCFVAEGRADIYPRFGPTMEWDTAAPHAVVRGVGKRLLVYESGQELSYNKENLKNPSFLVF